MPLNDTLVTTVPVYRPLEVPARARKSTIKKFVEKHYLYRPHCVFIELTEAEQLVADKIFLATEDGTTFLTGADLRKAVKAGNKKQFTLDPAKHTKYTFYVEVKSPNKQVGAGTKLVVRCDDPGESARDDEPAVPDSTTTSTTITRTRKRKISEVVADSTTRRVAPTPTPIPTPTLTPVNRTTGQPTTHGLSTTTITPVAHSVGTYDEIQIAFSYDTTGSMSACIERVKRTVQQTIRRLLSTTSNIKVAVMAHGDYCDEHSTYLLKTCDFSNNETQLCAFIENVGHTFGGDFPEAYEYVLNKARTTLSWKDKANKCIVMIGDAPPHEPSSPANRSGLDWRQEARFLKEAGIKCYGVKCLAWAESKSFYQELANLTGGFYLELAQFNAIPDFMIAISMRESAPESLEDFSQEIRSRDGNLTRNMRQLFATLTGNDIQGDDAPEDLTAVAPGRFQILDVDSDEPIKQFVVRNGAKFVKGKGFYEFMKAEEIQTYKEVVLMDKVTGDMYTGDRARELAGIGPHVKGQKQRPPPSDKWTMFIQSTSYNRKLISGTKFLYEAARDPCYLHSGYFDSGRIRLWQTILESPAAPMGALMLNYIDLGELDSGRNSILADHSKVAHSFVCTSITANTPNIVV